MNIWRQRYLAIQISLFISPCLAEPTTVAFDLDSLKAGLLAQYQQPINWKESQIKEHITWSARLKHEAGLTSDVRYTVDRLIHKTTITPTQGLKIALLDCFNLSERASTHADQAKRNSQYNELASSFLQDFYGAVSGKSKLTTMIKTRLSQHQQLTIQGTGQHPNYWFTCSMEKI